MILDFQRRIHIIIHIIVITIMNLIMVQNKGKIMLTLKIIQIIQIIQTVTLQCFLEKNMDNLKI
jgi:hypothetical protein